MMESVSDFVRGDRNYSMHGHIAFTFGPGKVEHDLLKLQELIREVDRLFPWSDTPSLGEEFKSIKYLSEGEVIIQNWSIPEKHIWFSVFPGITCLRRGQVYAYEKYLSKLAEELAKKKILGVIEVRGVIEVGAATSFRVQ